MKISVSIVNYKVTDLLLECLKSVFIALEDIESEVIVVDNNSEDNVKEKVLKEFPKVKFTQNFSNIGFGAAHNLALSTAKGSYFCILNPDTLLPQNIFSTLLNFAYKTSNLGIVGVQMQNKNKIFLPESKRNIPTLKNSFFKFLPFKTTNTYYAHKINKNEIQKVEIISGAFMFMPAKVFNEIKGFDERFFMFAEDIDISIKALKKGYINYYYGPITITHFKGKSTEQDPLYKKRFYEAMHLFIDKYYSNSIKRILIQCIIKLAYLKDKLFK